LKDNDCWIGCKIDEDIRSRIKLLQIHTILQIFFCDARLDFDDVGGSSSFDILKPDKGISIGSSEFELDSGFIF